MLAIACYPFSQALELKIHASNEFMFSNQQLASRIPGDLAKCGGIAPCPQVIVKFMTLLKPNVYVA